MVEKKTVLMRERSRKLVGLRFYSFLLLFFTFKAFASTFLFMQMTSFMETVLWEMDTFERATTRFCLPCHRGIL